MCNFRRTVPISGFESKQLKRLSGNSLDRKLALLLNKLPQDIRNLNRIIKQFDPHINPKTMRKHHLPYPNHTSPANIRGDGKLLIYLIKAEILPVGKPENRPVDYPGILIVLKGHPKEPHLGAFLIVQGKFEQMRAIEVFLLPRVRGLGTSRLWLSSTSWGSV